MLTYALIRRLKKLSERESTVGEVEDGGGQEELARNAEEAEVQVQVLTYADGC